MFKPEKFHVEMTEPSGITGNERCLVYIMVAFNKMHKSIFCLSCLWDILR